jgi:lysyl-tRNA synthetase class 1
MPHMNLEEEVAAMKGEALTEADLAELSMRAKYARKWLEKYAEDKFIFELQNSVPAHELTGKQTEALEVLADKIETETDYNGESLHKLLHEVKEASGLSPKEFFSAIYQLFLAKDSGPKVGWFLGSLEKEFVVKRLRQQA